MPKKDFMPFRGVYRTCTKPAVDIRRATTTAAVSCVNANITADHGKLAEKNCETRNNDDSSSNDGSGLGYSGALSNPPHQTDGVRISFQTHKYWLTTQLRLHFVWCERRGGSFRVYVGEPMRLLRCICSRLKIKTSNRLAVHTSPLSASTPRCYTTWWHYELLIFAFVTLICTSVEYMYHIASSAWFLRNYVCAKRISPMFLEPRCLSFLI